MLAMRSLACGARDTVSDDAEIKTIKTGGFDSEFELGDRRCPAAGSVDRDTCAYVAN